MINLTGKLKSIQENLLNWSYHKTLFYIICFLLPNNLGKHWVFPQSYVNGLLIDYYIPTIYITDLLLVLLIVLWVLGGRPLILRVPYSVILTLCIFLCVCIFSILTSGYYFTGFYWLLRILLYLMFFLYVLSNFNFKKEFTTLGAVLILSSGLVSTLGIAQWVKQSSVFNNYLVFGEQTYTFSTLGIVHEDFFGVTKVPPYSLFRHPNVLASYLVIVLLMQFYLAFSGRSTVFNYVVMPLNLLCLFFTMSIFSWMIFGLGIVIMGFVSWKSSLRPLFIVLLLVQIFLLHLLPLLKIRVNQRIYEVSLDRRSSMLEKSFDLFRDNFIVGVGLSNNLRYMEVYPKSSGDYRFIQPVHSIFALIASELGVFGIGAFFSLLLYVLYKVWLSGNAFLFSLYISLMLLGSFDHFFISIHQSLLLFLLTLGILLTYNQYNEV